MLPINALLNDIKLGNHKNRYVTKLLTHRFGIILINFLKESFRFDNLIVVRINNHDHNAIFIKIVVALSSFLLKNLVEFNEICIRINNSSNTTLNFSVLDLGIYLIEP